MRVPRVPADAAAFTAIILAAQRAGSLDPLAEAANVTHKCLAPIDGRPLIAHVVKALARVPGLARIRVCTERAAFEAFRAELGRSPDWSGPIDYVPAADNLADSIYAAAEGVEGPLLITTADNVLLTPAAVAAVLAAHARGAEVVLAMTTRDRVLAAHPEGQRRFYRLSDDSYSNCNLYGLSGGRALKAAESFRSGGQFAKNPARLALMLGPLTLMMARLGLISLTTAMRRISKRLGARVEAVILEDGSHAIDVDNERTYAIAKLLLERRRAA